MWLRRGLHRWLLPSAVLLPLWLLVGWTIFSAAPGTFLGVVFVLAPAVLVGQVVLTLLVRLRPSVRRDRAVSWRDALGVVVWQGMVVAMGCFIPSAGVAVLLATVLVFVLTFWSALAQLLADFRHAAGPAAGPDAGPGAAGGVFVIHEAGPTARH